MTPHQANLAKLQNLKTSLAFARKCLPTARPIPKPQRLHDLDDSTTAQDRHENGRTSAVVRSPALPALRPLPGGFLFGSLGLAAGVPSLRGPEQVFAHGLPVTKSGRGAGRDENAF